MSHSHSRSVPSSNYNFCSASAVVLGSSKISVSGPWQCFLFQTIDFPKTIFTITFHKLKPTQLPRISWDQTNFRQPTMLEIDVALAIAETLLFGEK